MCLLIAVIFIYRRCHLKQELHHCSVALGDSCKSQQRQYCVGFGTQSIAKKNDDQLGRRETCSGPAIDVILIKGDGRFCRLRIGPLFALVGGCQETGIFRQWKRSHECRRVRNSLVRLLPFQGLSALETTKITCDLVFLESLAAWFGGAQIAPHVSELLPASTKLTELLHKPIWKNQEITRPAWLSISL